jgi:tight adherence protein C
MNALVLLWALGFSLAFYQAIRVQPIGRPRPGLIARVESFQAERHQQTSRRPHLFKNTTLEDIFRPVLEEVATQVLKLFSWLGSRFGFNLKTVEENLRLTEYRADMVLFFAEKVAVGIIAFVMLPMMASIGIIQPKPLWVWLLLGIVGFTVPDFTLRSKAEKARGQLRSGHRRFARVLSSAASAGMALEEAVDEASRASGGLFFTKLQKAIRGRLSEGKLPSSAVRKLVEELPFREAEPLAATLEASHEHGAEIVRALRAHVRAIGQRGRSQVIEQSGKAEVAMVFPLVLLMLPGFLWLLLYPVGTQLLRGLAR